MQLDAACVVITGGAGGIGKALATDFRRLGAQVTTMDLEGTGADIAVDITDREGVARAFASLDRADVVIANAGIGVAGREQDLNAASWQRVVDVNLVGTVNTVLSATPLLRRQGKGALVIMASLSGLVATPLLTPYAMTKHALVGLGMSLRPELALDGIGVTVVCPGPVGTSLLDVPSATPGMSVRRYLTRAAGKPISAAALSAAVVKGVRKDRPLVTPGRARVIWQLQRLFPVTTARQIARTMKAELRDAGNAGSAPPDSGPNRVRTEI